jgi:hypothetical protein
MLFEKSPADTFIDESLNTCDISVRGSKPNWSRYMALEKHLLEWLPAMSDDLLDVKIALAKLVASICAPINEGQSWSRESYCDGSFIRRSIASLRRNGLRGACGYNPPDSEPT